LVRHLSFHLSGAQLGITATSLVLGFLAGPLLGDLLDPLLGPLGEGAAVAAALVLATVVQMVMGELVPKSIAIARPGPVAAALGFTVNLYGVVFGPLIRFLDGAANRTVRLFGIEPAEELSQVRTVTEFELMFRSTALVGTLGADSADLLDRALRLSRRTAADVLVPRTSVSGLPVEATVNELVTRSRRTGHSRFVVYGTDLDDLRGVVHVKAAYGVPRSQRDEVIVADVMGAVLAVPESRDLDDLLGDMRSTRHHLVAVVDEHGGTAGIVTLEDVLEQVVGDITDEHDVRGTQLTRPVRPGEWSLDGGLHLDDVVTDTGLVLPEGAYETLAGFVLDRLGRIPVPGDAVEEQGWRIEVEQLDRRRVARLRVVRPAAPDPGEVPS
jgi:CBS domain containing-hemolysin-like protein